jgi:hypothetical protein
MTALQQPIVCNWVDGHACAKFGLRGRGNSVLELPDGFAKTSRLAARIIGAESAVRRSGEPAIQSIKKDPRDQQQTTRSSGAY